MRVCVCARMCLTYKNRGRQVGPKARGNEVILEGSADEVDAAEEARAVLVPGHE